MNGKRALRRFLRQCVTGQASILDRIDASTASAVNPQPNGLRLNRYELDRWLTGARSEALSVDPYTLPPQ